MRSLGDKISSTIVAQSAEVPTMGWSGSHVSDTYINEQGFLDVAPEIYTQACIHNLKEGIEKATQVGYPIMIKASEGGGGKGIRKVESEDAFAQSYAQVLGEVPGSPVFIMKLAGNSRHLEVQLLADQYGNAISIFGRDCSVQRRHQKIIEEAPVTIAKPDTFESMEKAAVRLAKLVGYVSAGTVEYLYSHDDDKFYFLELNPRLQVEHPTTEMVSGVNIPAAQLQVAMGIPLHRIRDIRLLYGAAPNSTNEIDFDFVNPQSVQTQRKPSPQGHVIAVRITAENPDAGFKPSSGKMDDLNFRSNTNVWGYFSVSTAGGLHEFADSQFGHIFAFGENRQQSRKNMIVALKEISIRSEFRTTVEYLIRLLETNEFTNNTINTGWLDTLISAKLTAERPETNLAVLSGALHKAHTTLTSLRLQYKESLKKGQVPSKDTLKTTFNIEFIYENVRYSFIVTAAGPDSYNIYINGSKTQASIKDLSDGGFLVLLDGKSHTIYAREEVGATRLMIDNKTCLLEQENDPTQLRSPSPGKLVQFLVESGAHIKAGEAFAEIEVMKMYMPLIAAADGTVNFIRQPGTTLEAGDILGILTLDDPSQVKHATPFTGQLPNLGSPLIRGSKPHQLLSEVYDVIDWTLQGYDNQAILNSNIKALFELLRNPELPYLQISDILAALSGRLPPKIEEAIFEILEAATTQKKEFPATEIQKAIDDFANDPENHGDLPKFLANSPPLVQHVEKFVNGLKHHEKQVVINFLNKYYDVEVLFDQDNRREDEVVMALRDQNKESLDVVVDTVLSHSRIASKNSLILSLLNQINVDNVDGVMDTVYTPVLKKLADLSSRFSSKVAVKARETLIQGQLPSYEERVNQMASILSTATTEAYYGGGADFRAPSLDLLKNLIISNYNIEDVLQTFFFNENKYLQIAAIETYARRAYHAYQIVDVNHHLEEDLNLFEWDFALVSPELSVPSTPNFNPKRIASVSDLSYLVRSLESTPTRKGAMVAFSDFEGFKTNINGILNIFPKHENAENQKPNVLHVAIKNLVSDDDSIVPKEIQPFLLTYASALRERGIRRISFLGFREGSLPSIYTFRERNNYVEDQTIRHIEPATAYQLELARLSNFSITPLFIENQHLSIYHGIGKENNDDQRFFVRSLVRPGRLRNNSLTIEYLASEGNRILEDILNALEILSAKYPKSDCNQIFVNFIPAFSVDHSQMFTVFQQYIQRHGKRLWRQRVTEAEIRFSLVDPKFPESVTNTRLFINNLSGYVPNFELYFETKTPEGALIYKSLTGDNGSRHLQPILTPYPLKESLQPKRYSAHIMGTTYVYDFPSLFRQSLSLQWEQYRSTNPGVSVPSSILTSVELILNEHEELDQVNRPPGANNIGMVAWRFDLKTPEYPEGRSIVVIANDITTKIGSFGPQEDLLFFKASQYARSQGIPRIYMSANSGARIGLAEEVKKVFKVQWNDPTDVTKGFEYFYLTPQDYDQLNVSDKKSVNAHKIEVDGEERYVIDDIIGRADGLGVECLRGSGLIAGETSRAYNDIFTLTVVTCRSVGIGAYLVRLGQRTIQNLGQPIILTGAAALNKVLGREVYNSNLQLGGIQIMYNNGVSHLTGDNDLDSITKTLVWLSYVPKVKDAGSPIVASQDPVDREVEAEPVKGPCDPRTWLAGYASEESGAKFLKGFFDQGSFFETLAGWAKTVVTGRARLGGIPVGVIAVEARTVENVIPADPANPNSEEQVISEAGQVWHPNSAFKTAQAINDFNQGEQLPLFIFANWRGFSGGQRDMYNEILKYGSYIVDGLTNYKQPVFVYVIPNGELRGGAWVVLDPTINSEMMEMYADKRCRAGVLEPEGIVEIKYRKPQLLATMERLDETYKRIKEELTTPNLSQQDIDVLQKQLAEREEKLLPLYSQVAIQFADLHDRSGRMYAKGTIEKELEWKTSRRYFYWRLLNRTHEEAVIRKLQEVNPKLTRSDAITLIAKWFEETEQSNTFEADFEADQFKAKWFETLRSETGSLTTKLNEQQQIHVQNQLSSLLDSKENSVAGLVNYIKSLDSTTRAQLLTQLNESA
jgi:acetyl-CoA carboxylase/biotin carboxylase 1